MNGSLEQNRLAILTKIRLSRATYKNILTGDAKKEQRSNDIRHCFGIPNFPKSITLKFIEDHALVLLAATGCLIYVIKKNSTTRAERNSLTNYTDNFIKLKNGLYRVFRIGSHILKNPDHQHLTRWLGQLISQRLFKS
jgi:hypothetical protein